MSGDRCPRCRGLFYADATGPDDACTCGADWGPLPGLHLTGDDWDTLLLLLMARSGGRCEARIDGVCLGDEDGSLHRLPRDRVSIHHRDPRGMGGARRVGVHALDVLLLVCGDGSRRSCHQWVEDHRREARARGLLLRDGDDPAATPLLLAVGQPERRHYRRVWLDKTAAVYAREPLSAAS